MALKYKMFAYISAFILTFGMLLIGVFALRNVQLSFGGDLIFTAEDVNAKVTGNISGAVENPELPDLHFKIENTEEELQTLNANIEKWRNNSLQFNRNVDEVFDIVITINIENLSLRPLNIKIIDSVGTSENVTKTIQRDGASYTIEETASLESGLSTTFTITFEITDKTQSLSSAKYGYIIDLSDKSYSPPPVISDSEQLGTVSYQDNGDGTIIANAMPNEGYLFAGWQNATTGKFIDLNIFEEKSMDLLYLTSGHGFNLFNNYFIDYSTINTEEDYKEIETMLGIEIAGNIRNNKYTSTLKYSGNESYKAIFVKNNNENIITEQISDDDENFKYEIYKDAKIALVSYYSGSDTSIKIQENISVDGELYEVVGIKNDLMVMLSQENPMVTWLPKETNIKSVTLSNSFCKNGIGDFIGIKTLESVTLPDTLKSIGYQAFYNCSNLVSITIPTSVVSVGGYAFNGCSSLESITIPTSVVSIGEYAFSWCSTLTSVVIESADIYNNVTSSSECGNVLEYAKTIKVLKTAMGVTDPNIGHLYLNSTNFNVDTTSDLDYVIYTTKE